jgi:hypothetical protein
MIQAETLAIASVVIAEQINGCRSVASFLIRVGQYLKKHYI